MHEKWKIFALTFLSYSLIHAVRTAWSSLKYSLNSPPYAFSPLFLGTLDMIVLLTLAISLNLLGPTIEKLGPKRFLLRGIFGLITILGMLGLLLIFKVSARWPYALLYPLVGVCSCVGWPACIFILSQHFQKGMAFSLWNGSSQFGDFVALITSYIFIQEIEINPGIFLIAMALFLIGAFFLNAKYLKQSEMREQVVPQISPADKNIEGLVEEDIGPPLSISQMNQERPHSINHHQNSKKAVNFLTVWKLPGVPGYILSFLFVKSVNAVIVTWLIFYLSMINMVKQSRIIALMWAISTFVGGILGSYFNPKFNKKLFIAALCACAIFFVFLQEIHLYPNQIEVVVLIIACGLSYGGPFTLMSTSIPLLLSEKPEIREYPGAKAAIVSAMEGYGLLFCGISLLVIPTIGVIDLHWIASLYCSIAAVILMYEQLREERQLLSRERSRRSASVPVIPEAKDRDGNWSEHIDSDKGGKKKKRRVKAKSISGQKTPRKIIDYEQPKTADMNCKQTSAEVEMKQQIFEKDNQKQTVAQSQQSQKSQGQQKWQYDEIQSEVTSKEEQPQLPESEKVEKEVNPI